MQNSNVYINEIDLIRPGNTCKVTLCCCFFSCMTDYESLIQYLHSQERNYYNTLQFEKRIRSYLLGRFAAKKAVAALTSEENLTNIFIQAGIFQQPVVVSGKHNLQVSITHCDDFGAALAFPETHPMGIDIEVIDPAQRAILERQMTEAEKEKIIFLPVAYDMGITLLWTAKEALSKALKTGLMTPFEVFEISKIEFRENYAICYYKNFTQYKVTAFTLGSYVCSIVHPLKSELHLDIEPLKGTFSFN